MSLCVCGYRVKKDMDEVGGKLMGAHGYCTQVLTYALFTSFYSMHVLSATYIKDTCPQTGT